jgi:hypothetical protein
MSSVKEHLNSSTTVYPYTDGMRSTAGAGHTFRPLTCNAYRILGLSCSASQKEIFDAATSLRRALKLGVEKSRAEDLPWLGPVSRTEMDVRDALSRLANPAQRIYERLFWFYDTLQAGRASRLDDLQPAVDYFGAAKEQSARHDAALLALAMALRLHPRMEESAVWRGALALWKEAVEAKDFWSILMASDLKGDFEQLVTFAEIKELRRRTLQLISAPVADVAKDAAARRDFHTCRRALVVLRESTLPLKLVARYENDILGPIEDELSALCEEVFRPVQFGGAYNFQSGKLTCDETLYRFNEELRSSLKRFLVLAGAESLSVYRVLEMVAAGLKNLSDCYRSAGEEAIGVKICRHALALAPPGSIAAAEIEETLRNINDQTSFKTRTEGDYYRQLAGELEYVPVWTPSSPPQSPLIQKQEKSENAGCAAIAIVCGLALALGVICSKGGGSGSYNSKFPGSYNAKFIMPKYNANVYVPQPQFSPMPPIKLEPLVIPSLESGRRRPKLKRKKGAARQSPSQ